jgi:hypothetical protein
MHITFVKKIKADGEPCRKCAEVEQKLIEADLMGRIDRTVIADERDPSTEGMRLAEQYQVERAPFFVVEEAGGAPRIYTSYLRFLKEVLQKEVSEEQQASELLEQHPDIDYI